jgi:hypothetical protein
MNSEPGGASGRPPANRRGHLDPDALAEFRAGLITGRQGRKIAAHLTDCAECAALGDRLARVSALLAAAPVPAVPDVVARRLDSVLAAEAQNRIHAERTPAPAPSPGHGPPRRRYRGFQVRVLAQVAAGVTVLAGLGYGLSQLQGTSSSSSPSYSGAAPAAGRASSASSGAASGPSSGFDHPAAEGGGPVWLVRSDVDYQPATLRQQLTAQLAVKATLRTGPADPQVAACVRNLSGRYQRVLAESARYRGAPATVVVLAQASDDLALVAGSRCSGTDSDIVARVVLPSGISAP